MKTFSEKEVILKLKYLQSKSDASKGHFIGGLEEPKYLDELCIDIYDDMDFDMEHEEFHKNGKLVLDLSGSDRSLYELGKYLINLALYETDDPDFHEHFDGLQDAEQKQRINVIVRKQSTKQS
ncbi:MAG: hypothetical protein E7397_00075 [Ruminococcaceae bacterium]|nr:hypothetical protein [Oscillospiraceae bacterium]